MPVGDVTHKVSLNLVSKELKAEANGVNIFTTRLLKRATGQADARVVGILTIASQEPSHGSWTA